MANNLIKPQIYTSQTGITSVGPGYKYDRVEKLLRQNKKVCFTKTYGTVLTFYSWLKNKTLLKYPCNDYCSARIFRQKFKDIASNIFVEVVNGKINLKGAPGNPWFKEFYPDKSSFYISFPDFLGLNGAWQWFSKGICFPDLPFKIHPFYGTYFPTRFEHLQLFDDWLSKNSEFFNKSIDIGTGCGVLSFYMLKHNINDISATDINPNALYSVKGDLFANGCSENIQLKSGSFFGGDNDLYDLVVFNPPWIPGKTNTIIDRGIYYDNYMWDDFFNNITKHMSGGSRLLIIFSNFAVVAGVCDNHPVKDRIYQNARFKVNNVFTTKRNTSKLKSSKNNNWSRDLINKEIIELWDIEFNG